LKTWITIYTHVELKSGKFIGVRGTGSVVVDYVAKKFNIKIKK